MNSYTTLGNVRAIIVDVDGRPRFERYYSSSAAESRSIYSVTKSVTSTLVGIAISEGRLRLDESLARMLPRYAPEMKPGVARVTLRQLLTMTGGFTDTSSIPHGELGAPPDWVRAFLPHQDTAPGAEFHYSDYGAHLLAPILVQATGESVLAYARARLFDPLGIVTRPSFEPRITAQTTPQALAEYEKAGFAWPIDPQGFHTTESLIKLRPRDMATFGQLFLQAGQWNGRQVVPAGWVSQATTAQAGKAFPRREAGAFGPTNYGYFWWVEPAAGATAYHALGYGGQLIEVVPSLHLVIVVSSHVDETKPRAPVVGNDDLPRLVDAIVPIIKTHPTH